MENAMKSVLFRKIPVVPAANKWSKLGPSMDVVIIGNLCHRMLERVFELLSLSEGSNEGKQTQLVAFKTDDHDAHIDPALVQDASFSAVAGTRYMQSLRFIANLLTTITLSIFAVVYEPVRFLTAYWLRRARETDEANHSMLDMLRRRTSALNSAAQYLSTLLFKAGESRRVMMIWRTTCSSFVGWCDGALATAALGSSMNHAA